MELFDRIADPKLLVRRVTITAGRVMDEQLCRMRQEVEQLDLFTDYQFVRAEERELRRERRRQEAVLDIRRRFGKNAILRGMNLQEGATAMDRNRQIGGHKA